MFLHCSCLSPVFLVSWKYFGVIFALLWFAGSRSDFLREKKLFEDGFSGCSTAIVERLSSGTPLCGQFWFFFFFLILWTKVALFKKYNYQSHRFHIPSQRNSFWATVCWLFVLMLFRWHWADKAWLSNLDYLFTNNSLNINSVQNGLADFNYFLLSKVSRFVTKVVMLCL